MSASECEPGARASKVNDWRLQLLQEGWCGATISRDDVVMWEASGAVLAIVTREQLDVGKITHILAEALGAGQASIRSVMSR